MVFLFVHQCLSLSWCSEIINSRLDISKINSWCANAWGQRYADPDLGYYTCDDGVACLDGSSEIATWGRVWTVHDRPLFCVLFCVALDEHRWTKKGGGQLQDGNSRLCCLFLDSFWCCPNMSKHSPADSGLQLATADKYSPDRRTDVEVTWYHAMQSDVYDVYCTQASNSVSLLTANT